MTMLYRHFDSADVLLYVGISSDALRRAAAHGVKPWGAEICRINVEHYPSRSAALQAEKEAIRLERPRYNITHNAPAPAPVTATPGARRGRKPLPPHERLVSCSIRLRPAAMKQLRLLGMDWLRHTIRQAKLP